MSNSIYNKLEACLKSVREKTDFVPEIALVLGSGLGAFADEKVNVEASVNYDEIDGFPVSTVPGHKGRFVFGTVGGVNVAVMQGRVHYYEGYPISDVVLPARLLRMMGAKVLFLTNASGGINPDFFRRRLHAYPRPRCAFRTEPARWHECRRTGHAFSGYEQCL